MADPFIGEIRLFSFNFAPTGWAQCNGQLLQVSQNQALFTILSNVFGGDGKTTFGLPNLQGRVPIHPSQSIALGSVGGEEGHTLTISEMPEHTHQITASSDNATAKTATANVWGTTVATNMIYSNAINATMDPNALATAGGSAAHPNMQPYTVVNYCIALQGYYPPKN